MSGLCSICLIPFADPQAFYEHLFSSPRIINFQIIIIRSNRIYLEAYFRPRAINASPVLLAYSSVFVIRINTIYSITIILRYLTRLLIILVLEAILA